MDNQVNRVEALVDAIASTKGFHNPDSRCYQIKNPLMLRSFGAPGRHSIDSDGIRTFTSTLAGYKAATFDCTLKLQGKSRAGVKITDTLVNVLRVYGLTELAGQKQIVKFLRRALKTEEVSLDTPVAWFLESASEDKPQP